MAWNYENEVSELKEGIKASISIDNAALLNLKKSLSSVNNILTVNLTMSCAEKLEPIFGLSQNSLVEIAKNNDPNGNGYDLQFQGEENVLFEVKCNIPCQKRTNGRPIYGPAQLDGIVADIKHLSTEPKDDVKIGEYYKFMVLLKQDSDEDIRSLRNQIFKKKEIRNLLGEIKLECVDLKEKKIIMDNVNDDCKFDLKMSKDVVYVIFCELGNFCF